MNIHRALSDIAEIRAQLDRTETYRGFRSATVGISVLVLVVGCWLESIWAGGSAQQIDRYLVVWFCVAVVSATIAAIEMLIRSRVSGNQMVGKLHWSLAANIAPSFLVGFVVTLLIGAHAHEVSVAAVSGQALQLGDADMIWALPGLWAMIYSLGLFNCRSNLPAQAVGVAVYFLFAGVLLLGYNWLTREVAGWQMLVSFGVGQSFLALVLFWNLERRGGREEATN